MSLLQKRVKWLNPGRNLKIGDLVLVQGEDCHVSKWPIARVTELHPGKDNIVRVVTIKTASGIFKRPVIKLCLLMSEDEIKNS